MKEEFPLERYGDLIQILLFNPSATFPLGKLTLRYEFPPPREPLAVCDALERLQTLGSTEKTDADKRDKALFWLLWKKDASFLVADVDGLRIALEATLRLEDVIFKVHQETIKNRDQLRADQKELIKQKLSYREKEPLRRRTEEIHWQNEALDEKIHKTTLISDSLRCYFLSYRKPWPPAGIEAGHIRILLEKYLAVIIKRSFNIFQSFAAMVEDYSINCRKSSAESSLFVVAPVFSWKVDYLIDYLTSLSEGLKALLGLYTLDSDLDWERPKEGYSYQKLAEGLAGAIREMDAQITGMLQILPVGAGLPEYALICKILEGAMLFRSIRQQLSDFIAPSSCCEKKSAAIKMDLEGGGSYLAAFDRLSFPEPELFEKLLVFKQNKTKKVISEAVSPLVLFVKGFFSYLGGMEGELCTLVAAGDWVRIRECYDRYDNWRIKTEAFQKVLWLFYPKATGSSMANHLENILLDLSFAILAAGEVETALYAWERLLCYDPSNKRIHGELEKIARQAA